MKVSILGTGIVGRTLGARFLEKGHGVCLGTRDPADTLARKGKDGKGFSDWQSQHPEIKLKTFAAAAEDGEIILNCSNGLATLEVLRLAGASALSGKILIDISNPLDFSKGMPPTLFVSNEDSLAEQIQKAFPNTKVVKTLNTLTAALMLNPEKLAGGDHTIFISGNDSGAKEKVSELLRSFGWKDILDLGDITTARGAEMLLPFWIRAMGALKTSGFNFKIVRP